MKSRRTNEKQFKRKALAAYQRLPKSKRKEIEMVFGGASGYIAELWRHVIAAEHWIKVL